MTASATSGISASIVLYKTPKDQIESVIQCLGNSGLIDVLYVVDNSPDDSLQSCCDLPWVKYIYTGKNLGYGSAHNLALSQSVRNFDFHLVLNPDIWFESSQLKAMINRMQLDENIGQLMPKVLNADGSIQYLCKLLPTPLDLLTRRFPKIFFGRFFLQRAEKYELKISGYNIEMNVPNLSGCFMLFRAKALMSTGFFDERFFMYGEDIDLTRRIHENYITLYFPGATVTHLHARESYSSLKMLWVHCVNMARYFSKWGWINDPIRVRANNRLLNFIMQNGDQL